jgi:hypothetical protein
MTLTKREHWKIERGSSRSLYMENSLWKKRRNCRKTDCRMTTIFYSPWRWSCRVEECRRVAYIALSQNWLLFCVVTTVCFGVKSYNDQRNAQVFNLFMYLLLPYMFRAFLKPIFRGRALTPYPGDFNHCRSCTAASEDGLKVSPKHVGQK